MTMTKKTLTLTALGWTGCTAAAFWAGMHWPAGDSSAARDRARLAPISQSVRAAAEANSLTGGRGTGPASGSGAVGEGPVSRAKAIRDLTPEEVGNRLKEIFAMDDPLAKMEAYLDFMKGLEGNDQMAAAMTSLTENFSNRERGREFAMLMTRWAQSSPEAALAWTLKHPDGKGGFGAYTALQVWAQSDPDKAVAWALAHPPKNKEEGNTYLVGAIAGIAKQNLERATELAQTMERSEARGEAMDKVLDQYFKQRGSDAARDAVMAMPDGPYKNAILSRLAGRLAEKDVKSTAQWAASLPEGEAKPRVVTEVIDRWAGDHPNDAGAWLNGLPHSPQMDEPRERFAWKVQERDPEAAMAWANTITDEKRRNEAAYRIVRGWMEREPDNARAWVGSSQLPAEMKERLIRRRRG